MMSPVKLMIPLVCVFDLCPKHAKWPVITHMITSCVYTGPEDTLQPMMCWFQNHIKFNHLEFAADKDLHGQITSSEIEQLEI